MNIKDVIIIGGGQSALACGYYLRRTGFDFLIFDKQENCGGSWQKGWDSLSLFSPAEKSSLPGWLMPKTNSSFPHRDEVVDYLCNYEKRYKFPIDRPVKVFKVTKENDLFKLKTSTGDFYSKAVISATGIWEAPFVPEVEGIKNYKGEQLHSSDYKNPEEFIGKKVLIVGEGNSGAQILADVSKTTDTTWATLKPPHFLPDDVDGRVLFNIASAKYYAEQKGEKFDATKFNLGDIVIVPTVKNAREKGVLYSKGTFSSLYEAGVVWKNGEKEQFDTIIWCTGFNYATKHLQSMIDTDAKGKIKTIGTRAKDVLGLWMVGYGGWTGYASATLIGVGRSAKKTVEEIQKFLTASAKESWE